nr:PREDICTED: uncharacterized protein LOC107797002 [Nicotiana tabacum]
MKKRRRDLFISKPITYYSVFDEIITKSLKLHPDPSGLESFELCIPFKYASTAIPDVNKWILYLSSWRNNIKKLTLIYNEVWTRDVMDRHKLPTYFFSLLNLTSLKLQNVVLSPPPDFKGFLNLDEFILIGVGFADNCFESFLSSCLLLTRLVLHGCSGIHHFNISGSNLKNHQTVAITSPPDLIMFVPGSSPQVKILRLDGMFLHYLPVDPGMLSLEILQLKGVNFMDFNQTSALLCLLASALNLQQLHIEAASTNNPNQELQLAITCDNEHRGAPTSSSKKGIGYGYKAAPV